MDVWRVVLEETDRVGKMRLEAAECLEKILTECKRMKTDRANCVKMVCSKRLFLAALLSECGPKNPAPSSQSWPEYESLQCC